MNDVVNSRPTRSDVTENNLSKVRKNNVITIDDGLDRTYLEEVELRAPVYSMDVANNDFFCTNHERYG
jgi:hypothetical protein